jgi:hypothetical protein
MALPMLAAIMGGASLGSGALSYLGAQKAAGAQQQAAQQSGLFGLLSQQQALAQAREMAEKGAAAAGEYYGRGREDVQAQGRLGAETAREFYGQGVGFQEPYMQGGAGAFNQLAALYGPDGAYTKQPTYDELSLDPGYNFRIQQGQQAMLNAARGGGLAGSGAALKAATRFGAGEASQEYSNAYNRFMANRLAVTQGLQNIAGTGANAAQISSQLAGQTGTQLSGNQFNQGNVLGNLASNAGATTAGAYTGVAPTIANLASANPYGQAMENVGQARASGYVGGSTALGQALQGPSNAMFLASIYGNRGAGGGAPLGGMFGSPFPSSYATSMV